MAGCRPPGFLIGFLAQSGERERERERKREKKREKERKGTEKTKTLLKKRKAKSTLNYRHGDSHGISLIIGRLCLNYYGR